MKTTVNFYEFSRAFEQMDRKTNFSYEGLDALFKYIEEIERDRDNDTQSDLDVIALCCDYTEYSDLEEISKNYYELKEIEREDEKIEWLQDRCQVIQFETGIIISNF